MGSITGGAGTGPGTAAACLLVSLPFVAPAGLCLLSVAALLASALGPGSWEQALPLVPCLPWGPRRTQGLFLALPLLGHAVGSLGVEGTLLEPSSAAKWRG